MRTQFLAVIFPAVNHCVVVDVVETGDEFLLIYVFIIIFANNVYSEFNNVSNFIFHREIKQN